MASLRKAQIKVDLTEGSIRVCRGEKVLTLTNAMGQVDAENVADFIVCLDDIIHWDAPYDQIEIDIDDVQKIVEAIETEFARHGLSVEFE